MRDSITAGEFAYRVDHELSYAIAQISGDYRWWTLVIQSTYTDYPESDDDRLPPQSAPFLTITLPRLKKRDRSLADFEYKSFKIEYKNDADFLGMPGECSSAYAWDEHRFCGKATVSFSWASNALASVRVQMLARAEWADPGNLLYADTDLRFKGVKIQSHLLDPSVDAEDQFRNWFAADEFGTPIRNVDHILYPADDGAGANL